MGRQFFYRTIQVALLLVILSFKLLAADAAQRVLIPATAPHEQLSPSLMHGGEIELTGTHSLTGYSHQSVKKVSIYSLPADQSRVSVPGVGNGLSVYTRNTRRSVHLVYIFPFHYFW